MSIATPCPTERQVRTGHLVSGSRPDRRRCTRRGDDIVARRARPPRSRRVLEIACWRSTMAATENDDRLLLRLADVAVNRPSRTSDWYSPTPAHASGSHSRSRRARLRLAPPLRRHGRDYARRLGPGLPELLGMQTLLNEWNEHDMIRNDGRLHGFFIEWDCGTMNARGHSEELSAYCDRGDSRDVGRFPTILTMMTSVAGGGRIARADGTAAMVPTLFLPLLLSRGWRIGCDSANVNGLLSPTWRDPWQAEHRYCPIDRSDYGGSQGGHRRPPSLGSRPNHQR
jgi:hypothetical protein